MFVGTISLAELIAWSDAFKAVVAPKIIGSIRSALKTLTSMHKPNKFLLTTANKLSLADSFLKMVFRFPRAINGLSSNRCLPSRYSQYRVSNSQ